MGFKGKCDIRHLNRSRFLVEPTHLLRAEDQEGCRTYSMHQSLVAPLWKVRFYVATIDNAGS